MSIQVGILGATGYTGGELVRLLACHPEVTLAMVTSEQYAGQPLEKAFPHVRGTGAPVCVKLDPALVAASCQVVFCALPHMASMEVVGQLLEAGCRVVDLSADFRIKDAEVFAHWYGEAHKAESFLEEAVYGLPELNRHAIAKARLVANPGCYPTSVILALAPLLAQGLVETRGVVVDSKSGVSGAGRSPNKGNLFPEIAEGFRPYKVTGHRHIPEMEQELSRVAGQEVRLRFTPHLLPQIRGILSTLYLRPTVPVSSALVESTYRNFYGE
ncbi:MAG: N-acetyl-gamma-glutamyl-phosphate reductase, partial [Magnetococcales bacterium]|nr:N-acetyl-gamma-glutamyl-phosphate reductase [Magnetococcales bacterium]